MSTIRRRRALRNNIDDARTQPRSQSRNMLHNTAHDNQEVNIVSSSAISHINNHNQLKNSHTELNTGYTSSSESDCDEEFPPSLRFGLERHFSGYETGESSDMTPRRTRARLSKRNIQKPDIASSQHFVDPESSSDDNILNPKKVKRPLSPTSSSDTSDSGVPIAPKRPVKRMRVISSSEGSSSECSYTSDNDLNTSLNVGSGLENNVTITDRGVYTEYQPSMVLTRASAMESESDSDSEIDVVSIGHTVRGRRNPVIDSEDDNNPQAEHTSSNSMVSYTESIIQTIGPGQVNRRRPALFPHGNIISTFNRSESVYLGRRRRQVIERNLTIPESDHHNVWRVTPQVQEQEDDTPISNNRRIIGRRTPVVESEEESELNNSNNNEMFISEGANENAINLRRRSVSRNNFRASSSSSSGSSDSDNSVPIRSSMRHGRSIPIIDDLDEAFNEVDVNIKASTAIQVLARRNIIQQDNSSDSDVGDSEKCSICLASFKFQQIGKPTSCDHMFCCKCIKEWAKKNNTCPVDRKVFNGLVVYNKYEGKVICEVPIEKPEPDSDDDLDLFDVGLNAQIINEIFNDGTSSWYFDSDGPEEICNTCGNSDRPHQMISCDNCNTVFHLNCVDPPLRNFPTFNWYCSLCENSGTDTNSSNSD